MKVFIIGSGNIAFHMLRAFKKNDVSLSGIYARNEVEGQEIATKCKIQLFTTLKSIPKDSQIYLICVSDDAISTVVAELPKSIKKSKIIAHTSGSKSINETLKTCNNAGVFYPLQTFTKGKKMTYDSIPFCINGKNDKTINSLVDLAKLVSTSVQVIDDNQRKKLHLSAVYINNFINHMIYVGNDLLESNDINPSLLQPLLHETIRKQESLGAFEAQTGPARRLDSNTLASHLDLLKKTREYKAIYMSVSKSIQKTYNKRK